jgi:arylsulfatase A-like enzyme
VTPNLAELARQGTVFERAIAPGTWTLPSHASLFTGEYPDQHASSWHQPLDHGPTLAQAFERHGYVTGGFVGNLYYCNRTSGLDRGFQTYRDHACSLGELMRHSFIVDRVARTDRGWAFLGVYDELGRKDGRKVLDEFEAWRKEQPDRPFFAFLNFFDAHDPYLPAELLDGRRLTARDKVLLRRWRRQWPNELPQPVVDLARASYDAQIHLLDQHLGEVIAYLKRTGQYEDTLIVVTSDHGEQFGEHGLYSHGNSVRRPLCHVPLAMAWPRRVPAGRRVEHPVSLCDVGQTLLQVAKNPHAASFPGVSLATLWSGAAPATNVRPALTTVDPHPRLTAFPHLCSWPAAKEKQYGWLSGDWFMIAEGNGTWRLYDFARDDQEAADLAERPDHAERFAGRKAAFQKLLESTLADSPAVATWLTNQSTDVQTRAKQPALGGQDGGT